MQKRGGISSEKQLYHNIVEDVEDYAFIMLDKSGKVISWNKGAKRIKGYSEKQILNKPFQVFYTPEDQKAKLPEKLLEKARRKGKAEHSGWRVRKNGTQFWGNVIITALHNKKGALTGYLKVTRDLSKQQKLVQELKKSELLFRLMIETAPDALVIANSKGEIQIVNAQTEKLFGYSKKELTGKQVELLMPRRLTKKHEQHREKFSRKPQMRYMGEGKELTGKRKDGSLFPVEIALSPFKTGDDEFLVSAAIRDVSKLKRYVSQNKKLLNLNKELEQFAYIASHDLQEPLRTLTSFTELLHREYHEKLDGDGEKYLRFIFQSAKRMRELVKGLMDYSRIGKERELCRINGDQLIREVLSDMAAAIVESNATIRVKKMPEFDGYPVEMRQLFQNLLSNAIKFQQKDGKPKVTISAKKRGEDFLFSVSDNGIGIDLEKFKDRLFIIFKRLHNRNEYEGTGIGLSHCKKIVDLHGGQIWVESEPGKGSTFYFTIPIQS